MGGTICTANRCGLKGFPCTPRPTGFDFACHLLARLFRQCRHSLWILALGSASWRKMHAPPPPPPSGTAARGRQRPRLQQLVPPPPSPPPAPPTAVAAPSPPVPLSRPPSISGTLRVQAAAHTPTHTTQAASASAVAADKRPREAPAYEGPGRPQGCCQSQDEAESSSRQPSGRESLGFELGGRGGDGRPNVLLQESGVAMATKAEREGDGAPASGRKASPRGKRKLDGVVWTFGAGAAAERDARDRGPLPPTPGAADISRGSSSRRSLESRCGGAEVGSPPPGTTESGGCRLPGESPSAPSVGNASEGTSPVGQNTGIAGLLQAPASSRPILTTTASRDLPRQAIGHPGGGASTPSGSRAAGGGSGGNKRRHASEGWLEGDTAADAAGFSPAPSRPRKKTLPTVIGSPLNSSGLVGGRTGEAASSSLQVAGVFPLGSPRSAPTRRRGAGAATDVQRSLTRPKQRPCSDGAPAAANAVRKAVTGEPPAGPPSSPSCSKHGDTSGLPAAEGGSVDVFRPTSPAEGVRQGRTATGQMRSSPDRDRGRLLRMGYREEGRGEDTAMAGRCKRLVLPVEK